MIQRIANFLSCLRRDQRGVAAIEFAFVAPAFFALVLAVIDVGRYMWFRNTMQFAIDEAVRAGVIRKLSEDDIKARVATALTPINKNLVTVDVVSDTETVTVTANASYSFFFPISSIVSTTVIELRTEMPL